VDSELRSWQVTANPVFLSLASLLTLSCAPGMQLREITERLLRLLKRDRSALLTDEVVEIEPRSLSEIESSWVQSMLNASVGWENADISQTKVVAEGSNSEGILFVLQASSPENPGAKSIRNSVAHLWIQTADLLTANVQLAEWEGRLQELYLLIIDQKNPRRLIRSMPDQWVEVSREIVGFEA
jgi:hypothetical protein